MFQYGVPRAFGGEARIAVEEVFAGVFDQSVGIFSVEVDGREEVFAFHDHESHGHSGGAVASVVLVAVS